MIENVREYSFLFKELGKKTRKFEIHILTTLTADYGLFKAFQILSQWEYEIRGGHVHFKNRTLKEFVNVPYLKKELL